MRMNIGAMILAAGRGNRMRPLSDTLPKPLHEAGGKPLVVWQIEALARAGFPSRDQCGDLAHGSSSTRRRRRVGVASPGRFEPEPLEAAGGIATALPLLPKGPALIVSGDLWTRYDYASLIPRAEAMAGDPAAPRVHLVMVPNPPFHPEGDFVLPAATGRLALAGSPRLTFGNIGLYDTALFAELPRGQLKLALAD
jgi:MurNAc alpha-1-phosphate uridylyltransferase